MMFGFLGAMAKDLKNIIALEMLAVILGEGASSRLYNNLIENQPEHIFNMMDAENYSFRDGSNFFVQANFNPEYKEKAIELVKEEDVYKRQVYIHHNLEFHIPYQHEPYKLQTLLLYKNFPAKKFLSTFAFL